MQDFRIALSQCRPAVAGALGDNVQLMAATLQTTTREGAQLTAFPELSLSGYVTAPAAIRKRACALDDAPVQEAVALTRDLDTYAAFGFFEEDNGQLYNAYVLAGRGEILGCHRKVHTPAREWGMFTGGNEFRVFDLPFARVGLSICYDNEIGESHLTLAVQGAEVILMPAAWADHWEREDYVEPCHTDDEVVAERRRWMYMMFGARCRDTGTYSALINHAGLEGDGPWRFVGKSMVFAPTGRVLAEAAAWNDEILYADLDAQLLADYRNMDCYAMNNRCPAAYRPLAATPAPTPSAAPDQPGSRP